VSDGERVIVERVEAVEHSELAHFGHMARCSVYLGRYALVVLLLNAYERRRKVTQTQRWCTDGCDRTSTYFIRCGERM
jgi:hypothetical protein